MFELFDGSNMTDTTDVFVVNLKSGDVKGPFPSPWVYSAHHINAYEKSDSEIVLDMCPTPFENMREVLCSPMMATSSWFQGSRGPHAPTLATAASDDAVPTAVGRAAAGCEKSPGKAASSSLAAAGDPSDKG